MLSTERLLVIKDILSRLSKGKEVTLRERMFIKKYADQDQKITSWLSKAKRLQQDQIIKDSLDQLLIDLDLGASDPEVINYSNPEELGNWFSGAPSWVARS